MNLEVIKSSLYDIWPFYIIAVIILGIFRYLFFKNSRYKFRLSKELMSLLFMTYVFLLLIYLSVTDSLSPNTFHIIPIKELLDYKLHSYSFNVNIYGIIITFLPLGFFVGYYIKSRSIKNPLLAGLVITISLELIQYLIGRQFNIDDILLGLIGTLIGFIVFRILNGIKNILPNFLQKDGLYNLFCIIIFVVILLLCMQVMGVINIL